MQAEGCPLTEKTETTCCSNANFVLEKPAFNGLIHVHFLAVAKMVVFRCFRCVIL
jgi:hypothetical protein